MSIAVLAPHRPSALRLLAIAAVLAVLALAAPASAAAALTLAGPTGPTNVAAPTFTVTGALLPPDLYIDGVAYPMVPSALGEFIAAPTLPDGEHSAIARLGVEESNTLAFSVDTDEPTVAVTAPDGFVTTATAVTGTAAGAATVTVRVLQGGADIVAPATVAVAGDAWSAPLPGLAAGSYTVVATATDAAGNIGTDSQDFAVDTTAPGVSAALPAGSTANPQPVIGGAAGNAAGDAELVAVLVRGPDDGVVLNQSVARDDDGWSTQVPGALAPGVYTLEVTQRDAAGNVAFQKQNFTVLSSDFAVSPAGAHAGETVTLTAGAFDPAATYTWEGATGTGGTASLVLGAGPATVKLTVSTTDGGVSTTTHVITPGNRFPTAGFTVSPTSPLAGDAVTLTSTASDPDGPLKSLQWDLDGDGAFDDATGTMVSTSFPAGAYRVGLRAVDAQDADATAFADVRVAAKPTTGGGGATTGPVTGTPTRPRAQATMLAPFPIIRVAGVLTRRGAKLSIVSVRASKGARVRLSCKGTGCPKRVPGARLTRTRTMRFPALQRSLRAGARVEVFVSAANRIGKYTRFVIRKGKPPKRTDRCLATDGRKAITCPGG